MMKEGVVNFFKDLGWILAVFVFGLLFTASFLKTTSVTVNAFVLATDRIFQSSVDYKNNEVEKKYKVKSEGQLNKDFSARAWLAVDIDNGFVLAEHRSKERFPIASLVKLVTATVSIEELDQDKLIEIKNNAGGFSKGEKITIADLNYPLLMESNNEAANLIAGTENDFVEKMNNFVRQIGLKDTNFSDPSGISPLNQSTANDLFLLIRYLNKEKREVLNLSLVLSKETDTKLWVNNNKFVREKDRRYLGGKNGYTEEAGETLAGLFSIPFLENDNRKIAVVILGSKDREMDAEFLIDYISNKYYFGE